MDTCTCGHGPFGHDAEAGDCTWLECQCTAFEPAGSMDRLTAELEARAGEWYPGMGASEHAAWVARQVAIATA